MMKRAMGVLSLRRGGEKLYVHTSSFRRSSNRPEQYVPVRYKASVDQKGRPCAINVQLIGAEASPSDSSSSSRVSVFIAAGFLCFVAYEVQFGDLHFYVFRYYYLLSFLTFMVYGKDKWAAKRGAWRTPEQTLHCLALVGGWPVAIFAQQLLRHKSQKKSFRMALRMTVVVNGVIFLDG